jgi:hypothetical protein
MDILAIALMFILWLVLLERASRIDQHDRDCERWAQEILAHIRELESPNLKED